MAITLQVQTSLFCNRNFFFLWSAQAISQFGDGLTKVALVWLVYDLTGSALAMTMIGLVQTIPSLVLNPFIGVYLDRLPKKFVMIFLDVMRSLFIALIPFLYGLNLLSLELLYGLVFLNSVASVAFGPTLVSVIPKVVEGSELMAANAMIQSTANMGVLFGPAISGLLITFIQAQNVLWVNAVTFILSACCLIGIQAPRLGVLTSSQKKPESIWEELTEGIHFVFFQHPTLVYLVLLTIAFTLGGSALVFTLPIVTKQLPVEADVLGYLWSIMGAGMLVTSLGLTWVSKEGARERLHLVTGMLGMGSLAIFGLGLTQSIGLTFLFVGLAGASTAIFTPIIWSLVQEATPDHLLCRTLTLLNTCAMASASLGMLLFGIMTDQWGSQMGMFGIGTLFLCTAGFSLFISRHQASSSRRQPLLETT